MSQLPDGTQIPRIDGYTIDGLLGAGGMGAVFMGRRHSDGLIVAIKVMRTVKEASKEMLSRTKREIEMSKSLAHPYLIKILDGGTIPGRNDYFLVMEYLVGEDLAAATMEECLNEARGREIASHLAEALSYAHSLHLVHRDIKPANVFITDEDRTVLLDFGLALASELTRLTATGDVCGTFVYMAPEQLAGAQASARSDIYSLGVTLYRAMTGILPYEQDQLMAMCMGQKPAPPKRPKEIREELSQEFSDIIMRCMSLDPKERFPSADALKIKLAGDDESIAMTAESPFPQEDRKALEQQHISAALEPISESSETKIRSRRWPISIFGLLFFLFVIAVIKGPKKLDAPKEPVPRPIGRAFSGDVEPLRDEIIGHSWPPTSQDCKILGEVLEGAGVLSRMGIRSTDIEAAALYYLAIYTNRHGMKKKSARAYSLLVERFGPNVLNEVKPPIIGAMLQANKYEKLAEELSLKMEAAAERAPHGPIRNRLKVIALRAKVDALAGQWKGRQELIPLRQEFEKLLGNKPEGVPWSDLTKGYCEVLLEQDTEESRDSIGLFAEQMTFDEELLSATERITLLNAAAGALGGHYVNNATKTREKRHLDKALELTARAFELAITVDDKRLADIGIDLAGRYRAIGQMEKGLAILERVDVNSSPQYAQCNYHTKKARFLADLKKYEEAYRQLRKARRCADSDRKIVSIDDDISKLRVQAAIDGVSLR